MSIVYEQPQQEQADYLSHLAPPDMIELIGEGQVAGVAAISEMELERTPVGLVAWEKGAEDSLSLMWLYVAAEYRGRGIADELMNLFFKMAEKLKVKKVTAFLYQANMGDDPIEELVSYLMDNGFTHQKVGQGPWNISGFELAQEEQIKKLLETQDLDHGEVRALGDLSPDEVVDALKAIVPDSAGLRETTDMEISCVEGSPEDWRGIAVMEKYGDIYTPYLFTAKNTMCRKRLLVRMLRELVRKIQAEEYFRIWDQPCEFVEWIEKLLQDTPREEGICLESDNIQG